MKEIGEKLKEARENMGVSIEEAAEDLKLRPSQIENIEAGNMEAFQDIFYLKYFIRDYSKYLGLNKDQMVDEFNEYLFDYTSKISLDDIKEAQKKIERKSKKKIKSPYTIEHTKSNTPKFIIYGIIVVLILLISYFIYNITMNKPKNEENIITYVN